MLTLDLHVTQQQDNVRQNLGCNNYAGYVTLILKKRKSQQLYDEKLPSTIDTNSEAQLMLKKILKNEQKEICIKDN